MKRIPPTVWLAAGLGLLIGAWMVYDGTRALVAGDYVRFGGQLGPWEAAVSAVGIEPLSMRVPFIVWGAAWGISAVGLVLVQRWAWMGALGLSLLSLLYCCIGTVCALLAGALLLLPQSRKAFVSS